MIQPLFNGMLTILLAKFCLNDIPHAAGITGNPVDRPPTIGQLRYIAGLRQRLKMTIVYEREVVTFGEAGRMIRELKEEEKHRKRLEKLKSDNPNTATGTCYPDAWRWLMKEESGTLVHGTVMSLGKRIGHAWIETDSGFIWEPLTADFFRYSAWQAAAEPIEESRYTVEEAAIMVARTGNHGPWTAEERMRHIGR